APTVLFFQSGLLTSHAGQNRLLLDQKTNFNLYLNKFKPDWKVMDIFMRSSVKELAALVNGRIIGDETTPIMGVASLEGARKGDLVFVDNKKYLDSALDS